MFVICESKKDGEQLLRIGIKEIIYVNGEILKEELKNIYLTLGRFKKRRMEEKKEKV